MPKSTFVVVSFLTLLILSLWQATRIFWSLVTPIIFALVLLSIFYPIYRWLLKVTNGRAALAASLCVLIVFLLISVPIAFLAPQLYEQAQHYYEQLNTTAFFHQLSDGFSTNHPWIKGIREFALQYGVDISTQTLVDQGRDLARKFNAHFYDALTEIAANSLTIVLDTILTFVILFALLVRGRDLKKYLMELAPIPHDEQERLIQHFGSMSKTVFLANGVILLLEAVYAGLGFLFFDLGPATFWSVVLGIAGFIPSIGVWIILVPTSIILLAQGQTTLGVLFFVYNVIGFGFFELIVKPKFIGTRTNLNAVLVFLSILGGVQLFGVFGIFYGPMVVTMCLALVEIYKEHYRESLLNLAPTSRSKSASE